MDMDWNSDVSCIGMVFGKVLRRKRRSQQQQQAEVAITPEQHI